MGRWSGSANTERRGHAGRIESRSVEGLSRLVSWKREPRSRESAGAEALNESHGRSELSTGRMSRACRGRCIVMEHGLARGSTGEPRDGPDQCAAVVMRVRGRMGPDQYLGHIAGDYRPLASSEANAAALSANVLLCRWLMFSSAALDLATALGLCSHRRSPSRRLLRVPRARSLTRCLK